MKVGILGTGNLAVALGRAWAPAGRSLFVAGRDPLHSKEASDQIGPMAKAVDPTELATQIDVLVVAVTWEGLEAALSLVGAPEGSLAGKAVIDCTNPVDYTTCELKPTSGSAAALVAHTAPSTHVVKALHLFAGASWPLRGSAGVSAGRGDLWGRAKRSRPRCGAYPRSWCPARGGRWAQQRPAAGGGRRIRHESRCGGLQPEARRSRCGSGTPSSSTDDDRLSQQTTGEGRDSDLHGPLVHP